MIRNTSTSAESVRHLREQNWRRHNTQHLRDVKPMPRRAAPGRYSDHTDIDGHSLHVQAMPGYPVPVSSQVSVCLWGAICAEHLDFGVRAPQRDYQVVQ